ncbi:septum formation inhibitor Maf [Flavobacteriaceae bacterium TP-CH-4]|uniref:Septum formation inhibitor Maf n=1 Tax=Pelagihabitans pacificus TaxID=2696054 RepID=A0A967ATZ2_9FLAO|nr:septum formation inhibitor Maf [Pelagihabitans pacificus]NHF60248.1 septum formation inhibitor Maf [Pelagihabitans pacificus]
MKPYLRFEIIVFFLIFLVCPLASCDDKKSSRSQEMAMVAGKAAVKETSPTKELSEDFKEYWYAGEAEITSYHLEQARYGELREGSSVLVYVTEPFLPEVQVKANGKNPDNVPVLKLNSTKNYLTGIYPYSIMTSSFYPVHDNTHALKVSFSSQEWCGQVYAQLNNRDTYEVLSHSYFEGEADQQFQLDKTALENEVWNKIRVNPTSLPVGTLEMIPSLEYIRLSHKQLKPYKASATLIDEKGFSTYQVDYPELERTLKITFTTAFPYSIESWSESFKSGFGGNAKTMVSTATKMERIKSPYWQKNSNSYLPLRDSLGL